MYGRHNSQPTANTSDEETSRIGSLAPRTRGIGCADEGRKSRRRKTEREISAMRAGATRVAVRSRQDLSGDLVRTDSARRQEIQSVGRWTRESLPQAQHSASRSWLLGHKGSGQSCSEATSTS